MPHFNKNKLPDRNFINNKINSSIPSQDQATTAPDTEEKKVLPIKNFGIDSISIDRWDYPVEKIEKYLKINKEKHE